MLIAAGFILVFTLLFGSPDDTFSLSLIESYIKKEITDKERWSNIQAEMDIVEDYQKAYSKQTKAHRKELDELLTDYHTSPSDFTNFFDKVLEYENVVETAYIPHRIAIQNNITQQEWDTIITHIRDDYQKSKQKIDKHLVKFKDKLDNNKTKILKTVDIDKQDEASLSIEAFNKAIYEFTTNLLAIGPHEKEYILNKDVTEEDLRRLLQIENDLWITLFHALSKLHSEMADIVPEEDWKKVSSEISQLY